MNAKSIREGNYNEKKVSLTPERNSILLEKITYHQPQVRFYAPLINCQIKKITIHRTHVEIFMRHQANPMYENGGWVRLHEEIFIRPSFTQQQYPLLKAEGIPVYPNEHQYRHGSDCLDFKLIFAAIPIDTEMIDLIEKEPSDDSWFNFYGITLDLCNADIM
jgi:hypothetical protein